MAENNNDQVGRLPKTPHSALRRLQPLIGRWRMEGPDDETGTVRSRLMGTDGSRFRERWYSG
jgi:hypothetical protein